MTNPFRLLTAEQVAAISARNKASRTHRFDDQATLASPKAQKARAGAPDKDSGRKKVANSLSLRLPWPPTVNHYWLLGRNGRRYISDEGVTFRAAVKLAAMNLPMVAGNVIVSITAYPPDKKRRDIDNLLKSLLDALQHAGLIDDDSNVSDLRITRSERVKGGAVNVEVCKC